jgi:hypothetical protein
VTAFTVAAEAVISEALDYSTIFPVCASCPKKFLSPIRANAADPWLGTGAMPLS